MNDMNDMNDQNHQNPDEQAQVNVSIWPKGIQPTLQRIDADATKYAVHLERRAGVSIFFEDLDQITAWVDTLSALLTDTYLIHPDQAPLPLEVTS